MDREERNREAEMPNTTGDLVIETTIVIPPESGAFAGGDKEISGGAAAALGSSKEATASESSNLNQSSHGVVSETVLVIDSEVVESAGGDSVEKKKGLGLGKESVKMNAKSKISEEKDGCSALINVKQKGCKGFTEEWNGERVCRICYLASDKTSESKTGTSASELIQLGCDCKDELGISHSHCAEAWFKLKGNRVCEICGETAKNVEGIGDNRFMEEWNEGRSGDGSQNASNGSTVCWRGQPFCNFLMACLIIAFVLPWFFRINIF